jgi:hypothetical protein
MTHHGGCTLVRECARPRRPVAAVLGWTSPNDLESRRYRGGGLPTVVRFGEGF